jgi:hypothetical protein
MRVGCNVLTKKNPRDNCEESINEETIQEWRESRGGDEL